MTRPIRHRIHPQPVSSMVPRRGFHPEWTALIIVLIIGGIPFAICKYTEFSLPGPFDSGAYVYAAQALLEGGRLGTDVVISAQPATLLVNMLGVWLFGFNETGPKLIQMLMQLGALTMMYCTLRRLHGLPAAVVGTGIAAIYLSSPLIAKYGNVKEQFMISVMIMGICCFVRRRLGGSGWWSVIAGMLLLLAVYFKATGTSAGIGVLGYMVARALTRRDSVVQLAREVLLLVAGAAMGVMPLAVFFASQGQLKVIQRTFPVVILEVFVLLVVAMMFFAGLTRFGIRYQVWSQIGRVRWGFWVAGIIGILIGVGISLRMIYQKDGQWDDVLSYLVHLPIIHYPMQLVDQTERLWDWLLALTVGGNTYVGTSRAAWSFSRQWPIVVRYYMALKLPVLFALGALIFGIVRLIPFRVDSKHRATSGKDKRKSETDSGHFLSLFGFWWLFDMAFVWISPRSYEEYYLPLNASAAMTGGYLLGWYRDRFHATEFKIPWLMGGGVAGLIALIMVWPIFGGLSASPYSAKTYDSPQRGYAQRLEEVRQRRQNLPPWEKVAQVIRLNSQTGDNIFVWGWYPGIYVQAQRLSSAAKAFESDMHVMSPMQLTREVGAILARLETAKPVFIVDSRKSEFPWDRRPLELWPTLQDGRLISNQPSAIEDYDSAYRTFLKDNWGEDEMRRYDAMEPFRKFIREHYEIVNDPSFTPHHILFRLKTKPSVAPPQSKS